eukprot:scaffold4635_cov267-Pinguiococcus_pyrenoidosus.AAC.35
MSHTDEEAHRAYRKDPAFVRLARALQRTGGYPRRPDLVKRYLDSGELPSGSKSPHSRAGGTASASLIKKLLQGNPGERESGRRCSATETGASPGSRRPVGTPTWKEKAAWAQTAPPRLETVDSAGSDMSDVFAKLHEKLELQERACRSLVAENARLRQYCDVDLDGSLSLSSYEEKITKLRDQIVRESREKEELLEALRISSERVEALQEELSVSGPSGPSAEASKAGEASSVNRTVLGLIKAADASVEDIVALKDDPAVQRLLLRFDRLLRYKEAALEEAHKQNLVCSRPIAPSESCESSRKLRAARTRMTHCFLRSWRRRLYAKKERRTR